MDRGIIGQLSWGVNIKKAQGARRRAQGVKDRDQGSGDSLAACRCRGRFDKT